MPVKKEPSGHRSVEAEVEVPGTPEEVWSAIATGPGISSWFVPSQVEERVGGTAKSSFGPGMDSVATITEWDPPHRLVMETSDELGPDDPPVATEWVVEARSGGTCTVRVVHRWFTSSDDWDKQFEGHSHGWKDFFRILWLYLAHFSGQPCSAFQVMGFSTEPKDAAWKAFTTGLGMAGAAEGNRVRSNADAPLLAGRVERVGEEAYPEELLLRLDEPAPGLAHFFAMSMGGQVLLSTRLFLYGGDASSAATGAESAWQVWVSRHFPAAQDPGAA